MSDILEKGFQIHVPAKPHPAGTAAPHLIKTIENFYVRPRWLFVRIETSTGVVGWGEASLESHSEAVQGQLQDISTRWVSQLECRWG